MISYKESRRFCYEDIAKIENYALAMADETQIWDTHHRLEITMNCGARELIAKGAYFDRPAHELIFLTKAEHTRLHKTGNKNFLGKSHSDDTKRRIAEKRMGKPLSEETKRRMSKAHKGKSHSEEHRRKLSEAYPLKKVVEMKRKSDGFTQTFPSQSEAVRWLRLNGYPKADGSTISKVCSGRGDRKIAYNATWRYL